MSSTPVETSVEVKVRVESHFLKLPSRATEAFTKNLIVLVSGLISKTGTPCARDTEGSTADANKLRTIHCVRMAVSVRLYYFVVKHRDVDASSLMMHRTPILW